MTQDAKLNQAKTKEITYLTTFLKDITVAIVIITRSTRFRVHIRYIIGGCIPQE